MLPASNSTKDYVCNTSRLRAFRGSVRRSMLQVGQLPSKGLKTLVWPLKCVIQGQPRTPKTTPTLDTSQSCLALDIAHPQAAYSLLLVGHYTVLLRACLIRWTMHILASRRTFSTAQNARNSLILRQLHTAW